MTNVLILGANGQIARIVAQRVLAEQPDVTLTLYLRSAERVADLVALAGGDGADAGAAGRVRVVDGDIHDAATLEEAMRGQDIVYISNVDHDADNALTELVISTMKKTGVSRVIASNVLGIYGEVPGEFGRWNESIITPVGMTRALRSDTLLDESGLDYTTLRLPWLNDRNEIDYTITHKGEEYVGVSGSRQSMADVIVKIIAEPSFLSRESVGMAAAYTQGSDRPVY
ncbi:oxidoreductase [Alloscardovia macacae]|uniref:Oxidoreductase n=1 Tax=Alloscardovia macacae TaxID=1160091 RepID=A0A1Y2SXX4_9BIFI|nr:NAD(P)H-binding protein [Alloscardovia macacae]OTA27396.1 oxidoreductase [Alloscardovia macacae]OTA29408.1 oxidoreductase [Alloscardovia macacae]